MRLLSIVAASVLLGACSVDKGGEVDRLFDDYREPGMPGASVMVIRDGEPILTRSYGLARVEEGIPVTPETNFRLASVTKQFTATAILMLVDRGKLGLDDTLRDHYPQFPPFADGITIRHLLQHNSGIEDYEPIYGDPFPEQIRDRGVLELLSATEGTYFDPGSEYRYSNSAYAILAMLVEDLSGMSFPEFLQSNIFEPLGMRNTLAFVKGHSSVANRAYGYSVSDGVVEFADQSSWSAVLGDGGVYSSVEDLFTWDQALYDNDLLPAALWSEAWTPGLENYGFGWRIDEYGGHRRIHHSGSTSGFRNFMQRFPDLGLTIIVLTNRAEPDVQPLAEQVADLYL
jgi:CubicO group peptidase (beta-lactamase class C family)